MGRTKKGRGPFSTVSLPTPLVEEIERMVNEVGYWPTKTDFVREACLEKLEKCKKELSARGVRSDLVVGSGIRHRCGPE